MWLAFELLCFRRLWVLGVIGRFRSLTSVGFQHSTVSIAKADLFSPNSSHKL